MKMAKGVPRVDETRKTWGSGNVTDYAFHAGPGVNETSDEKRNLPCLLSPMPIARALLPLLFYGLSHRVHWLAEMERRAPRLRRWWVFNLFNIYMSCLGLTPLLSIWNCLWPKPASLKDPRQCLSYQNLFCGWPRRPTRYLKPFSSGALGDRKSCFGWTEVERLLNLLLFTLLCWRANLRWFKRWSA